MLHRVHLAGVGFKLTTLVVIGNYHTIKLNKMADYTKGQGQINVSDIQ
jgi:hypothetical protein